MKVTEKEGYQEQKQYFEGGFINYKEYCKIESLIFIELPVNFAVTIVHSNTSYVAIIKKSTIIIDFARKSKEDDFSLMNLYAKLLRRLFVYYFD